jgi:hypothetical protein
METEMGMFKANDECGISKSNSVPAGIVFLSGLKILILPDFIRFYMGTVARCSAFLAPPEMENSP